uniref:Uncharacterized protein n=2 Tax=Rhodnius prolixus TaxID=13249 RepID=A0A905QWV6_RHOPR
MDKERGRLASRRRSSPSVNKQQVVNSRRPKRVSKGRQLEDTITECKPCASRAKRRYAGPSSLSPTPSKHSIWDELSETGKWMEELRPFTRSRTGNCKCEVKPKKRAS